jgi:hypothetical protein
LKKKIGVLMDNCFLKNNQNKINENRNF